MMPRSVLFAVLFVGGIVPANVWAQSNGAASPLSAEQYGQLPLAFEKQGERFVARGQGYALALNGGKVSIGVVAKDQTTHAVSLEFISARPGRAIPGPELPGKINYIRGNDPKKWQIGLATYENVTYPNAYPGIDVVYYGNQQQLEFDLLVNPGAEPEAIRLKVGGAERLSIDGSGALDLGDGLRIALPQIHQDVNGTKKRVPGHYAIVGRDEVAFRIDPWDRTRPLVIDPTIVLSEMFGGGLNSIGGQGIGLDSSKNIVIGGYTFAADFPLLDAAQNAFKGSSDDVFVTKINPAGTALIYSTYLGGSSSQFLGGLAVDSTGAAWVTGQTQSTDFPVLNAAQSTLTGTTDAFVARLNSAGVLEFSTYLGGNGSVYGYGIAVDSLNNGYVTGTAIGTFATTTGVIQTASGGTFVTKYGPAGTVIYSTLLGGSGTYGYAIAVDSAFNAYVTGYSNDSTFAGMPAGGAQTTNKGNGDAFVAKINPTATAWGYFTFLGGTGFDQGKAIAVDASFNAYVGGQTGSAGLATAGAAYTAFTGGTDGFVAKLNSTGSAFTYLTYLGGTRENYLYGLALDGSVSPNVYLTGFTDSNNFPTVLPLQAILPGNRVSLFNSTNSGGSWSAFDENIPGAVFHVSINPAGTSDVVGTETGIYRTVNGGSSWTMQSGAGFFGYGSYLARSPVAAGTIYAVQCCTVISRSTDDGVTWTPMGNPSISPTGILADPLTATTLYLYSYSSPYVSRSTDAGTTWNPVGTGLPAGVDSMAATADGSLYAATSGSGVYKSTNQGGLWTAVNTGLSSSSYAGRNSLSASGTTVYFALGSMYKTTNGGASWTAIASNIGAGSVAASPQNASILYAVTYSSTVVESTNGGATWSSPGTGLPSNLGISELVVDPSNSTHVLVVAPVNEAAFLAKLNSTGSALIWSTYLGGTSYTQANAVASDGAGDAFVTGYTGGGGFPVTSSALPAGTSGAFITRISDATAACSTLTISPGSVTISQYSQTLTFDVVAPSGCAWNASTNESWAPISSGASGAGSGIVTVQVAYNSSNATQTANLTVGSHNATITQASGSCSFQLDKSSYPVLGGGGAISAVLTATAGCPWTVTNNYRSAVSFTTASSGTGSATIGMNVTPNLSGGQRNFYLSVGTAQIQLAQGSGAPTITAISDTADSSAPPLAQGSQATLYGMDLATSTAIATPGASAPFTLGGAKMTVNGIPAAMLYASPTQINFQIPYETATGPATVVVTSDGFTSPGFPFSVVPAAPGIFTNLTLSPNSKLNTAANPVAAGGTATVFYTGAGKGSPSVADGAAAPKSPLSIPVATATATIGGLAATVTVPELTPGAVGQAQANVQIPAGLTSAGSYPLIVTENGRSSLPATIYVSGADPVVTKVAPSTVVVGSPATAVTVTGSNFGGGSMLQFTPPGGVATLIAPTAIQATQIMATIPAMLLTVQGAAKVAIDDGLGTLSNQIAFTIAPSPVTITTLASSGNPSVLGQPVTFTATVSPATASGKVAFYDGTTELGIGTLAEGKAQLKTFLLPAGVRSIRADFLGGVGYLPSESTVLTQPVNSVAANDFAAAVNYGAGSQPWSIVVGDFNGDGKADLAIGEESGVQILLGNGDGTFEAALTYPLGSYDSVAAGDFNADGKTDLAVASGNTIYVLLGNGDGTFATAVPYGVTASNLLSIAAADFNGDGTVDLVAASAENGAVSVLLGKGDGTFETAVNYNSGANSTSVAVGDFNGDGKADLVVTNTTGTVNVLLGKGDGTFLPAVMYPAGSQPFAVAVADFNGDGKLDLAVANESGDVTVLEGHGDGTFGAPVHYGSNSYPFGIAVGDINGDGKPDIVVSGNFNSAGVLLGHGDGTFRAPVYYAAGLYPQPVAVADFNGDGRSDLAVGNTSGSNVSVLLGLAPTFGLMPTSTILRSSSNPSSFGQNITLTAQVSPSTATGNVIDFVLNGSTYLGTGTLYNGIATLNVSTLAIGSHSLTAVYPGDANDAPSISPVLTQVVNPAATATSLLSSLNPSNVGQSVTLRAEVAPPTATGTVTFHDGSTALGTGTLSGGSVTLNVPAFSAGSHSLTAVYSGDPLDTSSTSAVLTQNVYKARAATTTTVVSSLNPATLGQTVTFTATVAPASATGTVTFYDGVTVLETEPLAAGKAKLTTGLLAFGKRSVTARYDGDANNSPSVSAVLSQTVNALAGYGFAPAVNYGTGNYPNAVAVGDFNGDGKADLAIANESSGSVSILLGKGDGTFQPAVNYTTNSAYSVAVGDFNGDGKPDLAVGAYSQVAVLLGNGDGTFQPAVDYPFVYSTPGFNSTNVGAIAVIDLNGDGHADLVTANGDGALRVFLGKGDGTFATEMTFGATQPYNGISELATGDFNGDGIPDIAATLASSGSVSVFLGNGDGSFRAPVTYTPPGFTQFVAAGDFNGDGKVDLVVILGSTVGVLMGNGDGTFKPAVTYNAGTGEYNAYSVAVGDFNGDGKADLVVTDFDSNRNGSANVLLGNGDGTFQPPVNYAAGTQPYILAVADFNGDGRADLAVANSSSNNVSILLALPPVPTVNSVTPFSAVVNNPATAVTIAGSNFLPGSKVSWTSPGGPVTAITPSMIQAAQIAATIPAALLTSAGTAQIAITNGVGTLSNQVPFHILPFSVTGVSPGAAPVGSGATQVTVAGSNLTTATVMSFTPPRGSPVKIALSAVQAAQAMATIPAAYMTSAGTAQIALANSAGALSNPLPFFITPFTITSVTPNATPVGSGATKVTVAGTNLSTATTLAFTPPGQGAPFTIGLSTIAAAQAMATIPAAYLTTAGTAQVALANGAGALSNPLPFTIGVGRSPQTITFGALNGQTLGAAAFTVSATASSGLVVTFTSNTTGVCTVSVATVTLLTDGTCSLTASQAGNTSYAPATPVTQTFVVAGKPQTIAFGPLSNLALNGGAPPLLSATATSGLAVTFASNFPKVCTVTRVTVTLLTTGTCSITASQAGNSLYAAALSVTQTFTVSSGPPPSVTCTGVQLANITAVLRAEGQTELVQDVEGACKTPLASTGTFNVTLSASATTDNAILEITDTSDNSVSGYLGTASGTSITFANVVFPASFTFIIQNVRVNASTNPLNAYVTESLGVGSQNFGPMLVGYTQKSLAVALAGSPPIVNNYSTCAGNPLPLPGQKSLIQNLVAGATATNLSFQVNVTESFAGAFKVLYAAHNSGQAGENGSSPVGGINVGSFSVFPNANTATELTVTLANIPASATVYLPWQITEGPQGTPTTLQLLGFADPASAPATVLGDNVVGFSPNAAGTITASYVVTAAWIIGSLTFPIPIEVTFAPNTAAAQTTPMTVAVGYAPAAPPLGPSGPTTIPTFALSGPPLSGSKISSCQTAP
jgi:Bacterial Ig-like domain (group 3)/FG-GAP-like repeat/Beta-propeller repeat/FG-GAP repeat